MKKEDLIAMGLNEEQAEKVVTFHKSELNGNYIPKKRFDEVNETKKTLEETVKERDKQLEDLKKSNGDNEKLQKANADQQKAYEAQISQLQAQNKADKLNSAVKVALLASGASDVDYITFKLNERLNKDGITLDLDENGNVKGLDDRISELKTAFPKMFESGNAPEGLTVLEKKLPEQGDTDSLTRADVLKMPYPKRAELYSSSPEEFNKVMKG